MISVLLSLSLAHAAPLALSYEEALQRAAERNPSLLSAGFDQDSAEGTLLTTRSIFDPTLSANVGISSSVSEGYNPGFGQVRSIDDTTSWGAGLSQYLPTGTTFGLDWANARNAVEYRFLDADLTQDDVNFTSRLSASVTQSLLEGHRLSYNLRNIREARRGTDTAELAHEEARQKAISDVASAYWSAWVAHRLTQIAETTVGVSKEEARVVELQVAQGALAPVEKSRVAAARVQAEKALMDAAASEAAAADALLLLLGDSPGVPLQLTSDPAAPVALETDADAVVTAALEGNPSLRVARLAEESANQSLRDARHARMPQLDANASLTSKGFSDSLGGAVGQTFKGELPEWYVGANLSAPLGNRSDRGKLLSAQADLGKARMEREALERSVDQQVRAQVRTLETAKERVRLAQANLHYAEETLAAERSLREAGRAIEKDVLEAIKNADDARVGVEQARADVSVAWVELLRLKGAL